MNKTQSDSHPNGTLSLGNRDRKVIPLSSASPFPYFPTCHPKQGPPTILPGLYQQPHDRPPFPIKVQCKPVSNPSFHHPTPETQNKVTPQLVHCVAPVTEQGLTARSHSQKPRLWHWLLRKERALLQGRPAKRQEARLSNLSP